MGKHYVPQQYLRGFSVSAERPHVWMLDKHTARWTEPAIKQAAQSKDYFSPEVEARLAAEVESPGHEALGMLRAGQSITPTQRQALTLYLAVLVMRVPKKRRKAREKIPQIIVESLTEARRDFERFRHEPHSGHIDALLRELDRIERNYQTELPSQLKAQLDSPWPTALVLSAIGEMHWRVLEAPGHLYFISSDNPAHFFDSLGLGTSEAELAVPLSKRLCLHGSRQGEKGGTWAMKCADAVVRELNRRQLHGAERFVFSHRRAPWIVNEAKLQEPRFNRIVWDASA